MFAIAAEVIEMIDEHATDWDDIPTQEDLRNKIIELLHDPTSHNVATVAIAIAHEYATRLLCHINADIE